MIQKVEFDPQFKPAMQLAFAKTLICRDMEIATQFARSADMDCITLEGTFRFSFALVEDP